MIAKLLSILGIKICKDIPRKNIIKNSRNKNGYTGVAVNGKKWVAKININNKRIHLGTFKSPEEASQAYQKELNKL